MEFQEKNLAVFDEKLLLQLPAYRIKEFFFEKSHRSLQNIVYNIIHLKSIPKNQQNLIFNSKSITALFTLAAFDLFCRHRFSLDFYCTVVVRIPLGLPLCDENIRRLTEPSLYDVSRAWKMISFWAETPFWVSSLHAQPVFPVLTRIPPERKGDPSRVPLFHGRTPYICEWPATHGLGAICSASPWLSIHAALVSPAKEVARETRERRERNAHELHQLPRIKRSHTRRDEHGRFTYKKKRLPNGMDVFSYLLTFLPSQLPSFSSLPVFPLRSL